MLIARLWTLATISLIVASMAWEGRPSDVVALMGGLVTGTLMAGTFVAWGNVYRKRAYRRICGQ